jgi:GMP synthase (glutamine-hydrolysing)
MSNIQKDNILILDFGSQYTQLIARRVRELGVYCEVHFYKISTEKIKKLAPKGIILSGGPQTVLSKKASRIPKIVFEVGCPVLGICYGMQAMVDQLRGLVTSSAKKEYGYANLKITRKSKLFALLPNEIDVWMSHGDKAIRLPIGFVPIAKTTNTLYAAIEHAGKNFFGLQFHPEVTHTKHGQAIFKNFVYIVCGCKKLWTANNIICRLVEKTKNTVGVGKVLLALSGGVDSLVTALLLQRAVGINLICVFVDTGMLRNGEFEQARNLFNHFRLKVLCIRAKRRFLNALADVCDPETKRKIIGNEFVKIFTEIMANMQNVLWFAQGTIYSDVIESAQIKHGKTKVIKSHHNVGGLPKGSFLKLIEPVRELFKDEVRRIGLKLGLTNEMINRHPFPGPGLGIRIIGAVRKQHLAKLRKADSIFLEELHNAKLYSKVSQAFAVFLPIKSVGVMGDQRKYEYVIALRAIKSIDFMTAQWVPFSHKFLGAVSNRIINEIPGISRVVYDITGKPPATIEWE